MLSLDDRFLLTEEMAEDELPEYGRALNKTWNMLWESGSFSGSVYEYLSVWHDSFYLFDETRPFMQVLKDKLPMDKINKKDHKPIFGKLLNRRLSESNNKISLFSPKYEKDSNKEKLAADEAARWLIAYHGYTGLADKVIFGNEKYKASRGWLFDIGGISLEGRNLFETLMLNLVLVHKDERYSCKRQRPCWEYPSSELIDNYMAGKACDNLAQLYTAWSRAVYIDPDIDLTEVFSCEAVKLLKLEHRDFFLEPMSLWQCNEQGENKNSFIPKKHRLNEAAWRSFGLIALPSVAKKQRQPGVLEWLNKKKKHIGNIEIGLIANGMMDDEILASQLPADEIHDSLRINDFVLTNLEKDHWVPRIDEAVEMTKDIINKTYYGFLSDIAEIRNIKEKTRDGFINREKEALYFDIDRPFRNWLSNIEMGDDKDEKIMDWYGQLYKMLKLHADKVLKNSTSRDLRGIEKENVMVNVVTAHNKFIASINKQLNI